MNCPACGTQCGSISPNLAPVGGGKILVILDRLDSQQDFNSDYFAGRSGRLLKQTLQDVGIRAENCIIGCASGCFGESKSRWITTELFTNAEIIIGLGDGALRALCKKSGVRDKRGQVIPLHRDFGVERDVWVSYGIQDALKNPNYKKVIIQDLIKATNKTKESEDIQWEWYDGQEIPDSDVYAYDIETIDEKGNYTETATQCAIAGNSFCYVSRPNMDSANALATVLRTKVLDAGSTLVGHNSWNFDIPRTLRAGISLPLGDDTMVLAYLEDETQTKGLESLCVKHLGIKGWKDEFEHPLGSDEFALYNARDVVYTLRLYRVLIRTLGDRAKLADTVLCPAFVALSAMSERGIYISPEVVARIRVEEEQKLADSLTSLRTITRSSKFNPGSNNSVADYLRTQREILPISDNGNPVTSVGVLTGIDTEFTRAVLDYRRAKKVLGTYVKNYEKRIAEDGRIHSEFSLWKTKTGRSSSSKLNVQNNMRAHKDVFSAPPGGVYCEVDWDSVEFFIAAWEAQEPFVAAQLAEDPKWDPHAFFAGVFYNKTQSEVTKAERQVAKSANFGLLYLGNAHTLVEYTQKMGTPMDYKTCRAIEKTWHRLFQGFTPWYMKVREELEKYSEVRTATGHIRHFGDFKSLSYRGKVDALRESANVKVQGLAAHVAFISMAELDRLGLPLVNMIHDSFAFEFENMDHCMQSLPHIEDAMCNYPRKFLKVNFGFEFNAALRVKFEYRQC